MDTGQINYLKVLPPTPEHIAHRKRQVEIASHCRYYPEGSSTEIAICDRCGAEWWAHYLSYIEMEDWWRKELKLGPRRWEYTKTMGDKIPRERKYMPTLSDLLDRLSILQIKEVKLPEHKTTYAQEIKDILWDIDTILQDNHTPLDANFIRSIIILAQYNLHIWVNESNCRKGIKDGNNLELTHGLNSIRNMAKNKIQSIIGGRVDLKLDNAEPFKDWIPSW